MPVDTLSVVGSEFHKVLGYNWLLLLHLRDFAGFLCGHLRCQFQGPKSMAVGMDLQLFLKCRCLLQSALNHHESTFFQTT